MPLNVAVQMDPIERINIRGDSTFALLLEAQARGHTLGYYTPDRLAMARTACSPPCSRCSVRDKVGDHFTLGEGKRTALAVVRRGAAAAGPAVRPRLHHHHASARAHPSEDAGGQRSGVGAQRAGEDVRHRISRPDAADADHARPRRDQGVPRRARRHRDEAALRPRRRRGVPADARRPQLRLALRHVRGDVPRAVGGAEIPARGEATATSASSWSTANTPARSTACRRRTTCAPTWCAAARRRTPS